VLDLPLRKLGKRTRYRIGVSLEKRRLTCNRRYRERGIFVVV
jgi:hypothetical protein